MEKIIALGTTACNIAKLFESYDQYEVFQVGDKIEKPNPKRIKIPYFNNPEKYETESLNFKRKLSKVQGDVLFIVNGCSAVAAASLVILEYLSKRCSISLLYIKPEIDFLSEKEKLQERTIYNVLQQYARSAVFQNMLIVSNEMIEDFLQDVPLSEYKDSLNKTIVDTYHMINYLNHIKPVSSSFSGLSEVSRIYTIGFFDMENNEEKMLFPIDNSIQKRYYYAINRKTINTEKGLHKKIINQLKTKQTDDISVCYSIFETDYENNFAFVVEYSSQIQK